MTVETLLLCFCEDCVMNDGITRPYYMSKSLMVSMFIELFCEALDNFKEK